MVAINRLLKDFKLPGFSFEEVKRTIGQGFTPFIRSIAKTKKQDDVEFEKEVFEMFQKVYDEKLMEQTKLYNGVKKFIGDFQKLPNTKIGIVSNKPEYQVRIILKGLNIDEKHL